MSEGTLTLNQLPPDAKEIIKTKKIRAKYKLSRWLILLKTLSKFDSGTDSVLEEVSQKVIGSIILLVITLFIFIFALVFTEGSVAVIAIGLPIAVFGALRGILYGIKASKLKKVDLSNDFRETILPLFDYLSEDIQPKGKILLDLDMSDPSDKKFRVSKAKIPPGRFKRLTETLYQINCCSASIPLVNGTVLRLDISKKLASYDRYYRASSGKYKTKRKWKLLTLVTAAITPDTNDLIVNDDEVETLSSNEKIKLAEKKGGQLCKLTQKFKFREPSGSIPQASIPPEAIIEMYMKLCSTLKPQNA